MKIPPANSTNFVPTIDFDETSDNSTCSKTCIAASTVFGCLGVGGCLGVAGLVALHYEDIHVELIGAFAMTVIVAVTLRYFAPPADTQSLELSRPILDI